MPWLVTVSHDAAWLSGVLETCQAKADGVGQQFQVASLNRPWMGGLGEAAVRQGRVGLPMPIEFGRGLQAVEGNTMLMILVDESWEVEQEMRSIQLGPGAGGYHGRIRGRRPGRFQDGSEVILAGVVVVVVVVGCRADASARGRHEHLH